MNIKHSGAKFSAIVGIGEKLNELEQQSGEKYLRLNRGIPAVTNIDLSEIIPLIDFNSTEIQVYPATSGILKLRKSIAKYYFHSRTNEKNIFITAGGMNALDLVFKTLDTEKIHLPEFYWGAYANIMKINHITQDTYLSFEELLKNKSNLKGSTVLICDPNNPIGNKYDDDELLELVKELDANSTTIIWDSPYRKLFYEEDDDFYAKLCDFKNVIIVDSFSKSLGLSGQRIGFVHTTNQKFNTELNINILYATNGINGFGQVLVEKILSTKEGQKAAKAFRKQTVDEMQMNIDLLIRKNLLAEDFYQNSTPIGIFTVLNKSEEELLDYKIGSVSLSFFTKTSKELASKYSRICISIPHQEFREYFERF
ncbi:MAG: pyridoxal phosphate-dependent aminotransferase [Bacteroidales bacterium]|nr:pyridoxal phosphate-dependent aminotransferase [Bacteroidales bacterium]